MKRLSLLFILINFFIVNGNFYPQSRLNKIRDISIAPVSAFHDYCARCHGEEGSTYGKNFAHLREDSLKEVVEDMMFGPAELTPDSLEIEAMAAYNNSLKNTKPFAVVLNAASFIAGKEKNLKVEISPESTLETADDNIKISKNNNICELTYGPAKIKELVITVKKNKTSSSLKFPDEMWTK